MIRLLSILVICFASINWNAAYAQPPLVLGTYKAVAQTNNTVCVSVYGRAFNEILSMQYTLQWDNTVLQFKEVKQLNLPGLSQTNFGLNKKEEGYLTFMWYDPQLQGITLEEGTVNYEVCFDVVGEKGTTSMIKFSNSPTPIEISMGAGVLIGLETEGGKVEIR